MPELPEVEVVRRGLECHVVGRTIGEVAVLHPRPIRQHSSGLVGFRADLIGRAITAVRRRGKYLWLVLEDEDALLVHLGMSGQFRVDPDDAAHRHTRVVFDLDDGRRLSFVDQRMFGGFVVVPGGAVLPVPHVARDPFDPEFDADVVARVMRARRTTIKRALLDQRLVSGIGNIYADEALWAARVHYDTPTSALDQRQARGLLNEAAEVMNTALAAGGTSFDSLYVNVNGESGYFDRSLHAYGQEGRPCERCGTPIRREHFMNRSSFSCPRCQPAPRGS